MIFFSGLHWFGFLLGFTMPGVSGVLHHKALRCCIRAWHQEFLQRWCFWEITDHYLGSSDHGGFGELCILHSFAGLVCFGFWEPSDFGFFLESHRFRQFWKVFAFWVLFAFGFFVALHVAAFWELTSWRLFRDLCTQGVFGAIQLLLSDLPWFFVLFRHLFACLCISFWGFQSHSPCGFSSSPCWQHFGSFHPGGFYGVFHPGQFWSASASSFLLKDLIFSFFFFWWF